MEALSRTRAALLVVDIQERLAAAMSPEVLAPVVRNARILIEAARRMNLPIVVSEQYPKGLGPTIPPIEEAIAGHPQLHRFDKLDFSAVDAPAFTALVPRLARDQWIVCGMETHVCVYQSARGLTARGYAAHVACDAACSRTKMNWRIGLALIEEAGGLITSTETCVFDLLGRAGTDEFRALSKIIK